MTLSLVQLGRKAMAGKKGAAKYLAAIEAGDIAGDEDVKARRERCRVCKSRTEWLGSDWCGPALEEHFGTEAPTCGCLVYGKTLVASEACPQGRWPVAKPPYPTGGDGPQHSPCEPKHGSSRP